MIDEMIEELKQAKQILEELQVELKQKDEQIHNLIYAPENAFRERIAVLEKALELTCYELSEVYEPAYYQTDNFYNYFIEKAKEELGNDTTRSEG